MDYLDIDWFAPCTTYFLTGFFISYPHGLVQQQGDSPRQVVRWRKNISVGVENVEAEESSTFEDDDVSRVGKPAKLQNRSKTFWPKASSTMR